MIDTYITREEYTCNHCHKLPPDMSENMYPLVYQKFFEDFAVIRGNFGKPINISSGYRCPEYNTKIGGSLISAHMFGLALDLDLSTVDDVEVVRLIVEEYVPHLRMGVYKDVGTFIHIDCAYVITPRMSPNWNRCLRWYK